MEDPYGSSDSEDISSFLQVLLHNSSSSAAADPGAGDAQHFSGIDFSDLRNFVAEETDEYHDPSARAKHFASSCEESDASENRTNPGHPRCSSKRSRAAEVHNLSEKRRRSRINEKLKALQSLIPNSNKTDKASMLDEAIEYLKQLQLQVQMLTIRNGISLHPGYTLGGPSQPTLVAPSGPELGNGTDSHSRGNLVLMQNDVDNISHGYSTPQMLGPYSMANGSSHSGFLPSVAPSLENRYVDFNQLNISCSRNNSSQSPGVSS